MLKKLRLTLIASIFLLVSVEAFAETIVPPGSILVGGQTVNSGNGRYSLVMQTDGNLVLYRVADQAPRFNTVTANNPGSWTAMQYDGQFVVYNPSNYPLWFAGTAGNPNAFLAVQDDGNLVVYSSAGAPLWNIGQDINPARDPTGTGNVVGRDLAFPEPFNNFGHLGLWDGNNVVEVLNEGGNVIQYNSLANFKSRAAFWGTAFPNMNGNYSVELCFAPRCTNFALMPWGQSYRTLPIFALIDRAYQAYLIGADYTIGPNYRPAWAGNYYYGASHGLYRSDGFIVDMYQITVQSNNPADVTDEAWKQKMSELYLMTRTSFGIFDKFKSFELR